MEEEHEVAKEMSSCAESKAELICQQFSRIVAADVAVGNCLSDSRDNKDLFSTVKASIFMDSVSRQELSSMTCKRCQFSLVKHRPTKSSWHLTRIYKSKHDSDIKVKLSG